MVSRNLGFRFTLVSYNILSQSLLNDHNYLYRNCNPKDLEWPRRGHRILTELLSNKADIICLQEVEFEHLNSLYKPRLSYYGYDCLYKKKTGYKIDGCAIFYKRKLFHLLNFKGIEFNRTDVTKLLNRDNVGIIAVLEPKFKIRSKQTPNCRGRNNGNGCDSNTSGPTGSMKSTTTINESSHRNQQLVIANTHLIFNPKRSDIKLAQLKLFLTELDKISFKFYDSEKNERQYYPTILCGDLNSVPNSEINNFIMKRVVYQSSLQEDEEEPTDDSLDLNETSNIDYDSNDAANGQERADYLSNCRPNEQKISAGSVSQQRKRNSSSNSDTIDRDDNDYDGEEEDEIDSNELLDEEDHDLRRRFNLHKSSHPFNFESVYPNANSNGQPYVSTLSSCIVDYIFYTPKLKLLSYRELLTEEDLKNIGPIPNSEFPSDHLILKAKFLLE